MQVNNKIKIDAQNKHLLERFSWSVTGKNGRYPKACTSHNGENKHVLLHSLVMWAPGGYMIDHINGNALDNRLENLRIVTPQQNRQNSFSPRDFKGTSFRPERNNYRATLMLDNRTIFLGHYQSEEEAHTAYCFGSLLYFGEYANPGY